VIGGEWPYLTRGRKVLLILALIGLGYLLLQTRQSPAQLSTWSANPFAAAPATLLKAQPPAIVVEAAPQTGRAQPGDDVPAGNPLGAVAIVLTQGYGVGSHAPAAIWGGVDLAIDGNGDGQADPEGTFGMPVYATQAGIARVKPDTWPGGNYLAIEGAHYKIAYAHLSKYAVEDGQAVERGQVVGYIGSTGQSSGPHLHYEVWQDGVNVNPLDYGALDAVR
jgi:murein DD-endopeptidase MepM/ murein hydrolase activator NlpD